MDARENDYDVLERAVPEDVGETSENGTVRSSVTLRIREGIVYDPRDGGVHRLPKFTTEPLTLALVPILDRH